MWIKGFAGQYCGRMSHGQLSSKDIDTKLGAATHRGRPWILLCVDLELDAHADLKAVPFVIVTEGTAIARSDPDVARGIR